MDRREKDNKITGRSLYGTKKKISFGIQAGGMDAKKAEKDMNI